MPLKQLFFLSLALDRKQLRCDLSLFTSLPVLSVTVCPCNVRGNCKIAAKQLQGMPTIQSAVGILLGTFAVIGKKKIYIYTNILKKKHLSFKCVKENYFFFFNQESSSPWCLWDFPTRTPKSQSKTTRRQFHLRFPSDMKREVKCTAAASEAALRCRSFCSIQDFHVDFVVITQSVLFQSSAHSFLQ